MNGRYRFNRFLSLGRNRRIAERYCNAGEYLDNVPEWMADRMLQKEEADEAAATFAYHLRTVSTIDDLLLAMEPEKIATRKRYRAALKAGDIAAVEEIENAYLISPPA